MVDVDSKRNEERLRRRQSLTTRLWVYGGVVVAFSVALDILNLTYWLQLVLMVFLGFLLYFFLLKPYRKELRDWGKRQPDESLQQEEGSQSD